MTATTRIEFYLTDLVWCLLGLDDHAYIAQVYPTFTTVAGNRYSASEADARAILDVLTERSAAGGGYDHSAGERRSLRLAAVKLRAVLDVPGAAR